MDKKFIVIIFCICFLTLMSISGVFIFVQTSQSDRYYISGLEKYNNSEFITAKKNFKRVGRFSSLKPAAIYREALCANKLNNKKEELKKYRILKFAFPKSIITPRAVYLSAKLNYKEKKYSKALREFKYVNKKYPDSKYAIASNYYIALILSENDKKNNIREILKRTKDYILKSPDGIYAIDSIKLMEKYPLSDEEKFIIAKVYLTNKNPNKALTYFQQIDINQSWPYLVQIYYDKKDYERVQNFTRLGLSSSNEIITKEYNNAAYKAIDIYLKTFTDKKAALASLLNLGNKNSAYDYLMYKNCQSATGNGKFLCFNSLYQIYSNGNFAAEALSNLFFYNVVNKNYDEAIKLGNLHLLNYKNVKSTPKILYWLTYISYKTNNVKDLRMFYNKLMQTYPDDYYTYLAFSLVNNTRYNVPVKNIMPKPVEFPYDKEKDLLLTSLLYVNDYGLINTFYDDDDFIKSWVLYSEGNYNESCRIARDAMDKLNPKPDKKDLRWRLVYPVNYFNEIEQNSSSSMDKTLILSIIREESFFNPHAKSSVGARGLMQLMPKTAKEIAYKSDISLLNEDLLYDVSTNIKLGKLYFSYIKNLLSGKPKLAILAYNGGIGSVNKWLNTYQYDNIEMLVELIPYQETQNYFKKVYRTYWNYLRIYDGINF